MRGKSSYFPFRPGGLENAVLDDDELDGLDVLSGAAENLEKAFEKGHGASLSPFSPWFKMALITLFAGGIRTIPPGFTRGLDFGPIADAEGVLLEEEEEVEVKPVYRPMLELSTEGGRARLPEVRSISPCILSKQD